MQQSLRKRFAIIIIVIIIIFVVRNRHVKQMNKTGDEDSKA